MTLIAFSVPGQPHGKGRPRVGKVGQHVRMFTPAKSLSYEGLVAHSAQQAMRGLALLEGPCVVTLDIVCQIPASWSRRKQEDAIAGRVLPTTKPDVDNVEKAIFDGLNGVAWRDDCQVVRVIKGKRYGATPGVHVEIAAAEGAWWHQQQAQLPEVEPAMPQAAHPPAKREPALAFDDEDPFA